MKTPKNKAPLLSSGVRVLSATETPKFKKALEWAGFQSAGEFYRPKALELISMWENRHEQ